MASALPKMAKFHFNRWELLCDSVLPGATLLFNPRGVCMEVVHCYSPPKGRLRLLKGTCADFALFASLPLTHMIPMTRCVTRMKYKNFVI